MMPPPPVLLWFRDDLRLGDNPAFAAALATAVTQRSSVIGFYCLDDISPDFRPLGGAARWWLHHSLTALAADLTAYNIPLRLRRGAAAVEVPALVRETGARQIFWNRRYAPAAIAVDTALKTALTADGITVASSNAALLVEPWEVTTGQGRPFQVFSPFWKAARPLAAARPPQPQPLPVQLPDPPPGTSEALADWSLRPTRPDWAGGLRAHWTPGAAGAAVRLQAFIDAALSTYADQRDRPDRPATSALSPHLRFGEISPRQIWAATDLACQGRLTDRGPESFTRELGWREFSYHLLYHQPDLARRPIRPQFAAFPWQPDDQLTRAWQRGQTGYPIVDAGMRQLWHTGWMHNRVRMLVGSLLVKHLLQPWQQGEAWFWDTLVDADPASNPASWQWVAGCGADAAPYFRIFNPVLQGEKFDPDGDYVRRWVPELARLPARLIHKPWEAPALVLREAGVVLGRSYPNPCVGLAEGRDRALAAFHALPTPETV